MNARLLNTAVVALGFVGTSVAQAKSISGTFNGGASSGTSNGGGSKGSTGGTVPYFPRPTRYS